MKVVVDMNLSPEWAGFLSHHGVEAVHWSQVGDARADDRTILAWARGHAALVFTNDLDFGRILALTSADGPSVLQVRNEDLLPEAIGRDVLHALQENEDALASGALLVLDEGSKRVRVLPLGR